MKKNILVVLLALITFGCESKPSANNTYVNSTYASKGSDALVGSILDEQDRNIMEQTAPKTVEKMNIKEPLNITDIIKLSQGGVSDDTIIKYMQDTKTTYNLSQRQIDRLQEAGVSQRVISYMMKTGK
jgi:hypothetical protein